MTKIDFNIDEYVSEILSCIDEPISKHDLAECVADTAMSQGYCENENFDKVVAEIEKQLPYYL